jgi:hypothetical protein
VKNTETYTLKKEKAQQSNHWIIEIKNYQLYLNDKNFSVENILTQFI